MKLLKVRKAFLIRLTLLTVYLTVIIALVYHLFIPDRYFLWFPAIPVYYYLCGLFYVFMFETSYRMGEKKLITAFLVCKVSKFILSAFILMFYGFVVAHEVLAFTATFLVFYFGFLILETRFFFRFEEKLKAEKKKVTDKSE